MITLQEQIFTCKGWNQMNLFYEIELVIPVGDFPAGTKFVEANFDSEKSLLQLMDFNGRFHNYKLNIIVGDKI